MAIRNLAQLEGDIYTHTHTHTHTHTLNSYEKTRLNHSLFHFTNLRGRERKEITNLVKRKEEEARKSLGFERKRGD